MEFLLDTVESVRKEEVRLVNWVGVKLWNTECQNGLKEKYNDTDSLERAACPPSRKQWSSPSEPHSVKLNVWFSKMRSQPLGHGAAACLLDSAHLEKLIPASPAAQELDSGLRENSCLLSQRRVDVGISAHLKAGVGTSRLEEASGNVAAGEEGRQGQVRLIGLIVCH